jgi:hypothetical protein
MKAITVGRKNLGWEIFLTKLPLQQIDESIPYRNNVRDGFSSQLIAILENAGGNDITLGTALTVLSRYSHAALFVFLSFPLCIPVGVPVFSTTLGVALGLVGLLLALGRDVRIPQSMAKKTIPYKSLASIIQRFLQIFKRIERWFHPRMPFFVTNDKMIRIHGIFVMLMGFTAAIPLPLPFNNLVAALPILLLGLSLLEKDGALVIASYLASIPCFIYYGALIYLGNAGYRHFLGI